MGLCGGGLRLPLVPMSQTGRQRLIAALQQVGLLKPLQKA